MKLKHHISYDVTKKKAFEKHHMSTGFEEAMQKPFTIQVSSIQKKTKLQTFDISESDSPGW